jgi:hypothetical protein
MTTLPQYQIYPTQLNTIIETLKKHLGN